MGLAFVAAAVLAVTQQGTGNFRGRITVDTSLNYLISLPDGYDADKRTRWPIILFLHGSGERGNDVEKVKLQGIPKELANGRKLPFIIVSPQCPERDSWASQFQVGTLTALLDDVERKYRVDKDREYLTGLSMGGYGTWALAAATPRRFAAIAPICGAGDTTKASLLKDIPVWATHGDKDPAVPFEAGKAMVDAVKAAGGEVRFDVIPDGGHDVWTAVYAAPDLYDWFLTKKRR